MHRNKVFVVQVSNYAQVIGRATWKYVDGIIEILWYILKTVVFPQFTFRLRAGFATAYVKTTVYASKINEVTLKAEKLKWSII